MPGAGADCVARRKFELINTLDESINCELGSGEVVA